MKQSFLLLCLLCYYLANVEGKLLPHSGVFHVGKYGARGDGKTDDSQAFLAAWNPACSSTCVVHVVVPRKAYFLASPMRFIGPCKHVTSIRFHLKGYLKASTDLNKYENGEYWVLLGWVDNLKVTGKGTFDGQGSASWGFDKCPKAKNCKLLPTSIKFVNMNNTSVIGITSLNSKFFHISLVNCNNFKGSKLEIIAPGDSPNTDGIHIDRSNGVRLFASKIGTGDDCISIGHGNTNIYMSETSLVDQDTWPSKVQIKDVVHDIKGTSTTPVGVTLRCSQGYPCKNVKLHNVDLRPANQVHLMSSLKGSRLKSTCSNVKASYSGTQSPPPCG